MDDVDRTDLILGLAILVLFFTLHETGVLGVCLLSGIVGFLLGRSFPHESLRIRPGKEDDPRWIRTR
jgi:hypothetical protein